MTHCVTAVLWVKKDALCTACVQSKPAGMLLKDTGYSLTQYSCVRVAQWELLLPCAISQKVPGCYLGEHRQNHGRGSADNKTVQEVARQCVILHLGPDLFGANNSGNVTASISISEAHELSGMFCSQFYTIKGPCFLQALSVKQTKGEDNNFQEATDKPIFPSHDLQKYKLKRPDPHS